MEICNDLTNKYSLVLLIKQCTCMLCNGLVLYMLMCYKLPLNRDTLTCEQWPILTLLTNNVHRKWPDYGLAHLTSDPMKWNSPVKQLLESTPHTYVQECKQANGCKFNLHLSYMYTIRIQCYRPEAALLTGTGREPPSY